MNYKKISMFLFVAWSIMLVLILTFGTEVASLISNNVSQEIYEQKNKTKDVIIEEKEYLIEDLYYLDVKIVPDTNTVNDLIYTSLTPDIFEIEDHHYVRGKRLDSDRNVGKLQITSISNPEFKKEVDLVFVKTYPTSFEFFLCDAEHLKQDSNLVYLDTNFFLSTSLKPNDYQITEKRISFNYDEKLFELVKTSNGEIELKPKYLNYQIGDFFEPVSTSVEMVLNEKVVSTLDVVINPILHAEAFDTANFAEYPRKRIDITDDVFVKQNLYIELFKDGLELVTPFNVTSSDEDIAKVSSDGEIQFLKRGKVDITVSLKNGFSKTYSVNVRNKVLAPLVTCTNLENNVIVIKKNMYAHVHIDFPSNASYTYFTYEIDDEVKRVDYDLEDTITIYGSKVGDYSLVIRIDEGFEEVIELKYMVKVIENENSLETISHDFSRFLGKVLGHMSFFVLQAILAFFMMYYHKGRQTWLNVFIFTAIGVFTAWTSEFIQLFMKGRSCSIDDVIIDLSGYIVGTICSFILYGIIKLIKRKKKMKIE